MKRLLFVILSFLVIQVSLVEAAEKRTRNPNQQTTNRDAKATKKRVIKKTRTSNVKKKNITGKAASSARPSAKTPEPATAPTPILAPESPAPPPAPKPSLTDSQRSMRHKIQPPPKVDATWWLGPRLAFWQESISASRGANKTTFPSQFMGAFANASRRGKIGKSVRWLHSLGFEAGLGTVKASSSDPAFADRLKNQPWLAVGINPGVIYRGTLVTDVYLSVPLIYRKVFWTLEDNSLDLGREQSHSAGLSILTANRLSESTTFVAGLVHQVQWKATQWLIGFDYHF